MTPLVTDPDLALYLGDAFNVLSDFPEDFVDCMVTSPPYQDARPEVEPVAEWSPLFRELARVVRGPALLNLGRLWRGGKELRWHEPILDAAAANGWHLLDTVVWIKPNANPIHGRVLADSHEMVYVLGPLDAKLNEDAVRTEYDPESLARFQRRWRRGNGVKGGIREQDGQARTENPAGARGRSFFVAYVGKQKGNPHPSPMALELAEYLVLLGSWPGQTVLDPFAGSGTTLEAARRHGRHSLGIELDPGWAALCADRLAQQTLA